MESSKAEEALAEVKVMIGKVAVLASPWTAMFLCRLRQPLRFTQMVTVAGLLLDGWRERVRGASR